MFFHVTFDRFEHTGETKRKGDPMHRPHVFATALIMSVPMVSCADMGENDQEDMDGSGAMQEGGAAGDAPPMEADALGAWLAAGNYLDWSAESAVHASTGPHGTVRTFVNAMLETSLASGQSAHPQNAAAVKELYKGTDVVGWAVEIKVSPESNDGDGWYWYEEVNGKVLVDGMGIGVCTDCHKKGMDYVLTPYPLQ